MLIVNFFTLSNQRLKLHLSPTATQASAQPTGALWHRNNAVPFLDGSHCLPFPFSSEERQRGRQGEKKVTEEGGGVSLQWIAVSLSGSLHHLIFKSPMLTLAHPPFLLAGQALYYSDKSMRVCVCADKCASCACLWGKSMNVRWLVTGMQRRSCLPKLDVIASLIPKAIRDSVASSPSFNHSLHHWCNLSLADEETFNWVSTVWERMTVPSSPHFRLFLFAFVSVHRNNLCVSSYLITM